MPEEARTSAASATATVQTPVFVAPAFVTLRKTHGELPATRLKMNFEGAMAFLATPALASATPSFTSFATPLLMPTVQTPVFVTPAFCFLLTPNPNPPAIPTPETPFWELFTKAIHIAKENSRKAECYKEFYRSPDIVYSFESNPKIKEKEMLLKERILKTRPKPPTNMDVSIRLSTNFQVLNDVVVFLSQQLQKEQLYFYSLITKLGGKFLWLYGPTCTHFVYMGNSSDENDNELNLAKQEGRCIVSPKWLIACLEQSERVSETPYLIGNEECDLEDNNDSLITNDKSENDKSEDEEEEEEEKEE
jgi:hypothetical protein